MIGLFSNRIVFAALAVFLWGVSTLFSIDYFGLNRQRLFAYYMCSALCFCGVLGAFFAQNLLVLYGFFELMSLSAYALVAHDGTKLAKSAAKTYLKYAVFGGVCVVFGIAILQNTLGTLALGELQNAVGLSTVKTAIFTAAALLICGFGAKAGLFPLHGWLAIAHPAAPAPASALLSGIMTKTGVFGLIIVATTLLRGEQTFGFVLLAFALVTMLAGAVLALFTDNIKRIFACSSVSQIGFITLGIALQITLGSHGEYAQIGLVLHSANHALIKLALFLAAGAFYLERHSLKLSDLRGAARKSPFAAFAVLCGGFSVIAFPGFGGFSSKTLLHEAILEQIIYADSAFLRTISQVSEWIFIATGALTVVYILRVLTVLFCPIAEIDKGNRLTGRGKLALVLSGVAVLSLSAFPFFAPELHIFTLETLKSGLTTLVIGIFAYYLLKRQFAVLEKKSAKSSHLRDFSKLKSIVQSVATLPDGGKDDPIFSKLASILFPAQNREKPQKSHLPSASLILLAATLTAVLLYILLRLL